MGNYKFLPDVATADIAFEAVGNDLEDLFTSCADAVFEMMGKNVGDSIEKTFELENKDIEKLLFDFLSEIIYLKDTEYMVFSGCEVEIKDGFKLKAVLKGEKIDQEKQELGNDVKAVTMYMFKVVKEDNGYKATVVVDI